MSILFNEISPSLRNKFFLLSVSVRTLHRRIKILIHIIFAECFDIFLKHQNQTSEGKRTSIFSSFSPTSLSYVKYFVRHRFCDQNQFKDIKIKQAEGGNV